MKYINKLKDTIIGILILIMMIFVVAMAYKPFVDIGVNILTSNIDLPKSYEEGLMQAIYHMIQAELLGHGMVKM